MENIKKGARFRKQPPQYHTEAISEVERRLIDLYNAQSFVIYNQRRLRELDQTSFSVWKRRPSIREREKLRNFTQDGRRSSSLHLLDNQTSGAMTSLSSAERRAQNAPPTRRQATFPQLRTEIWRRISTHFQAAFTPYTLYLRHS